MPKSSPVWFFKDFAEPRTGLQVRFKISVELRTGPSVQVQKGPVLVQEGFKRGTELFLIQNVCYEGYIDYDLFTPPNWGNRNKSQKNQQDA